MIAATATLIALAVLESLIRRGTIRLPVGRSWF